MNIKKTIIMLSMAFSASSLTMYAGPADGPIDDEAVKTYAEMVNMSERYMLVGSLISPNLNDVRGATGARMQSHAW